MVLGGLWKQDSDRVPLRMSATFSLWYIDASFCHIYHGHRCKSATPQCTGVDDLPCLHQAQKHAAGSRHCCQCFWRTI